MGFSGVSLTVKHLGPWAKAHKILKSGMKPVYRELGRVWREEARFLQSELKKGIKSQAPGGQQFKPLAQTTIAIRRFLGYRGTQALLWHRNLLRAIKVTPEGRAGSANYKVFVGIHKSARNPQGKSLYMIGMVHENGSKDIVVRITPRMRRFLGAVFSQVGKYMHPWMEDKPWWLHKAKGGGVIVIRIPARPVFQPIWNRHARFVGARITANLNHALQGTLAGLGP